MSLQFNPNDKVFAKVRGYPPWPARVQGVADETPNKVKYHVYFYGTRETAVCKADEMYDYLSHREKYGKPAKRKNFMEALSEIEEELDPADRKQNNTNVSNVSTASSVKDSDDEGNLVIDETPKGKQKPSDSGNPKKRKLSASEGTPNSSEVVSRSGRKIKPKKFSDSEVGDSKDDDGSDEENIENDKSEDRSGLQKSLQKKVAEVKNMKADSFPANESLELLKVEVQLLDSDCRIKSSLSLSRANTTDCLRAMDELLDLKLTALMLKKHPEVVETVKKLRRYVGNVQKWDMTQEEENAFNAAASEIRVKAEHVYNKFKSLFTIPSGQSFLEVYNQEVLKFNSKIVNLSVNEVYGLVKEPTGDGDD